jgi:hypothetical protein
MNGSLAPGEKEADAPAGNEHRTNKRPLSQSHQVSPSHQTVVDARCDAVLRQIAPLANTNLALQREFSAASSNETTTTLPPLRFRSDCSRA